MRRLRHFIVSVTLNRFVHFTEGMSRFSAYHMLALGPDSSANCLETKAKRRKLSLTKTVAGLRTTNSPCQSSGEQLDMEQPLSACWCLPRLQRFGKALRESLQPRCKTIEIAPLSLGRVDPGAHTQRLRGVFLAIAQNSLLWSLSIVDFGAQRHHYFRGSEELAILETAGSE